MQQAATERARIWAERADQMMTEHIAAGYPVTAAELRDMARTWAAVAGQYEFVTMVAEPVTEVILRPAVPGVEVDERPYPAAGPT